MLNIYSIYDAKIEEYQTPFFAKADGAVIRGVLDAMENKQSDLARHPEDFTVFRLGVFDEETASIDLCASPQTVCKVWELNQSASE